MGRSMKMGCLVVLGILAFGIILSMVNDGGQPGEAGDQPAGVATLPPVEEEQAAEEAPAEQSSEEQAPAQNDTPVNAEGDIVVNNEVRWKILEVEVLGDKLEGDGSATKDLAAEGAFIGVRFEVQNVSPNALTFLGMTVVDDKQKKYNYSADALPFVVEEEACETVTLEADQAKTCTAIYDVPVDAQGLAAVLTDLNLAGGQQEVVSLGIE